MAQTNFTFEYVISIVLVLIVGGAIQKASPGTSIIVKMIAGLVTAYISLYIMNTFIPKINSFGTSVGEYAKYSMYSSINRTGYAEIYPPLLAVLIMFIVLAYSGNI